MRGSCGVIVLPDDDKSGDYPRYPDNSHIQRKLSSNSLAVNTFPPKFALISPPRDALSTIEKRVESAQNFPAGLAEEG